MITGVGIDLVRTSRFVRWKDFSSAQLEKIFSSEELSTCQHDVIRLATRFAAKEAFFKALSTTLAIHSGIHHIPLSLLFICRCAWVHKSKNDIPMLVVRWDLIEERLGINLPSLTAHLSLSHEREYACAIVILEKKGA